jgi:integrase
MKVKLYLARPTIEINGKRIISPNDTVIFARISYAGYRLKYYLDESINPKYWNNKDHKVKETSKFPQFPEFNNRLKTDISTIEDVVRKYYNDNGNKYPSPDILKPLLDIALKQGGNIERMTFIKFFADFIERSGNGIRLSDKGQPITAGTVKTYETTKTCLENYQAHSKKRLDFETIDMFFYTDFRKYLTLNLKLSTNYIGKHVKTIKTVLRDAENNFGIAVNPAYKSSDFTTIKENADTVYLPEHELKHLADLDLSDDHRLDTTRDLFLIGCYTGLRFSDLSTLTPEHIKDGMITITAQKTGQTVVIPLHKTVKKIMDKYNGELPPAKSNQKTNEALKDLCKKPDSLKKLVSIKGTKGGVLVTQTLEKYKLVTTHTARRSFATNQYLNKVPAITIMAITGHQTESAFMKYIKVAPDEHAKILQTVWKDQEHSQPKTIAI